MRVVTDAFARVAAGYAAIAAQLEGSRSVSRDAEARTEALEAALRAIAPLNDVHVTALAGEMLVEARTGPPTGDDAASVLLRRAQALLKLGRDRVGLAGLRDLWERRPDFGPAARLLAFAVLDADPQFSLDVLDRARRAGSRGDPRFASLEAEALIAQDRLEEAEAALNAAFEHARHPDLALGRANCRADALSKTRQMNLAFAGRFLATVAVDGDSLTLDRLRTAPAAKTSGPLVSVIVTTFNSKAFVGASIRSLLAQTYDPIEIIVVDDASADGTADAVEALARSERRLRLVRLPANGGVYAARNAGVAQAAGAFVLFQDSDDWAHPQKVARSVSLLEKTGAVASTSRWARIDEGGRFQMKNPGGYLYRNASTLIRKAALDEIGAFQNVRVSADSEHYHRVLNRFGQDAVLADPAMLTIGLARPGSLTASGPTTVSRLGASLPRAAYNCRWIDAQMAVGRGTGSWRDLSRARLAEDIEGVAPAFVGQRRAMTIADLFARDSLGRLKRFVRSPRRLARRVAALQARLLAEAA